MFFLSRSIIAARSTPGNLKSFISLVKSKLGILPKSPDDEFAFSSAIYVTPVVKVADPFNERLTLLQRLRRPDPAKRQ